MERWQRRKNANVQGAWQSEDHKAMQLQGCGLFQLLGVTEYEGLEAKAYPK